MSFRDALLRTKPQTQVEIKHKATPQSKYIGTEMYYREKLGDKLPDYEYNFLEMITNPFNEDKEQYLNSVKEYYNNEYERILEEFKERDEEYKEVPPYTIQELNVPEENYFIAVENQGCPHLSFNNPLEKDYETKTKE